MAYKDLYQMSDSQVGAAACLLSWLGRNGPASSGWTGRAELGGRVLVVARNWHVVLWCQLPSWACVSIWWSGDPSPGGCRTRLTLSIT